MKSLLQTFPKARTVLLWNVPVKTNLHAVVDLAKEEGSSDAVLVSGITDALADIEMHDLLVKRASVMMVRGKISIWMTPGPGNGIKVRSIRTRRYLAVKRCAFCKRHVHADPDKDLLPMLAARFHRTTCPTVLALLVMET